MWQHQVGDETVSMHVGGGLQLPGIFVPLGIGHGGWLHGLQA